MAFHARPRYTKDMDLLVEPSIENGSKIVAALKEFGFVSLKLTSHDFIRLEQFIQLGYEPVRIDLITSITGCTFEQIWRHRVQGRYGRARTWFIGKGELIRNKRLSGRRQDKVDIEILQAKNPWKNIRRNNKTQRLGGHSRI